MAGSRLSGCGRVFVQQHPEMANLVSPVRDQDSWHPNAPSGYAVSMQPNPLIVRSYVFRGAKVWAVLRLGLSAIFLLASIAPLDLPAMLFIGVIALSVIVGFVETRLNRETALLTNLGVSSLALAACFAAPAIVGEVALRLVGALFS